MGDKGQKDKNKNYKQVNKEKNAKNEAKEKRNEKENIDRCFGCCAFR